MIELTTNHLRLTTNKKPPIKVVFFVEMRGVEPLSEKAFIRTSTCVVYLKVSP